SRRRRRPSCRCWHAIVQACCRAAMSQPAERAEASEPARLVLASSSRTRARLLEAAGVPVATAPAGLDEAELKRSLRAAGAQGNAAAETLAEMKAQRVSRRQPGALVIGADQLLVCE